MAESKIGTAAQQLVRKIGDVASKTATKLSPIVEGTVISRNPDGSLNVDDGRGGCLRMAPRANVRVGEKIRLGTEPSLGSQTSLPQLSLSIDASTRPCPDDPRPCIPTPGVPCPEPKTAVVALSTGFSYGLVWRSHNANYAAVNDPGGPPGTDAVWSNRITSVSQGSIVVDSGNRQVGETAKRKAANYNNLGGPLYADRIAEWCWRIFLEFDTSAIPADATILSASIAIEVQGGTPNRLRSDNGVSVYILPSSANGSISISNWAAWAPVVLGSAAIADIIIAAPHPLTDSPFSYSFPLSDPVTDPPTSLHDYFNPGGLTLFALLAGHDLFGSLPVPASFTNIPNPNAEVEKLDHVAIELSASCVLSTTYIEPETP